MGKKTLILFSVVFALLLTGFIGASFDSTEAGAGPLRNAIARGVHRRAARREARWSGQHYSGYTGSAGSYSGYSSYQYGSGSSGSNAYSTYQSTSSAGSYSGYSAPQSYAPPVRQTPTYAPQSGCPNCGNFRRWR